MNALEKINIAILLATISYIIAINNILTRVDQIEPAVRWFITFLTSVGLFRLLIILIYRIIRSSDTLLAIYDRGRFLKGLWTYHYAVNGKAHMGIWRITQDLATISITGYGVDPTGRIDSHFRSISPLFEHQGVDEIMFARTDSESGVEHFSKTTFDVDCLSRQIGAWVQASCALNRCFKVMGKVVSATLASPCGGWSMANTRRKLLKTFAQREPSER